MQSNARKTNSEIAVLIATRPRTDSLLGVALPSVSRQTRRPGRLVIVSDKRVFSEAEQAAIRMAGDGLPISFLCNVLAPGAAGTWNTGLQWLHKQGHAGFVAILDDDDEWDPGHLALCEQFARDDVDVVLSGLRAVRKGEELPRWPLLSVDRDDFLSGNPGWQGSNTFVRLSTLMRVGGFWNGLPSTNDRDLAVRLLSLPDLSIAFTGKMTATWHLDAQPDALSRRGGPEKRAGLQMFLQRHGHLMSAAVRTRFLTRARELFGLDIEVPSEAGR